MSQQTQTPEAPPEQIEIAGDNLLADILTYTHDPLGWVKYAFPWADPETELKDYTGPDTWQEAVLKDIGQKLRDQALSQDQAITVAIREAIAAGNGPGKSALVAWIILWGLSTYEDARGVVTANTDTQLRTKTWAELSKWYNLCICKHWFKLTATAIYSIDREHERTWRIDQVPWSLEKTEAFAGLHNKGKRVILIFDEASAIPDKIWETAEGALTDKDTEIIWLVSGNPTRNVGRFKECWTTFRNRWQTWQVDIRTSILVNQQEVKQWIEDLGIDSDWVRAHVLGLFPKASDLQFIPSDIAEAAKGRGLRPDQYYFAPKIIGVDMAWTGGDEIVIRLRQGLMTRILQKFAKNDNDTVIAKAVARHEDEQKADQVFIDLGYGTGVYSYGKQAKRNWMLVSFGAKASKMGYLNKRSEMWGDMKQWLIEGGCLEKDDQATVDDLTAPEAIPRLDGKIQLESKEKMAKRGIKSPSNADALALTFAFPVRAKPQPDSIEALQASATRPEFAKHEYNPLA